uniref:Chitin-binding type-2 domain-containing protein n=2 Tax=Tetranychus urticae TaxID=32264 RepID=T1K2N5_TETUR
MFKIIVIIASTFCLCESAVWTSLNNRGVEPRVRDRETQIASSSQLIHNYSLLDKSKGKLKQLPKVVYNDHGDIISSASNLIRDDADIGFDHEDDTGGPIENYKENVYNSNLKAAAVDNGDDAPNDFTSDRANNDGPVTVIPSPPTVSPLWLNENSGDSYGDTNGNRSNFGGSYSNKLVKFDDVTPTPPIPMASTRSPRIIRARKRPQKGKDSSSNRSNDRENGGSQGIFRKVEPRFNSYNRINEQIGKKEPPNNSFESTPFPSNYDETKGNSIDQMNRPKIKSYTDLSNQWDVNPFGQPGIDFPSFSSPPLTSFRCSSQRYPGYYADPEAYCQAFYICQPDGREDAFLCPNGTLFNQKYFICDWYFNVDCSQARSFYSLNSLLYVVPNRKTKSARLQGSGLRTNLNDINFEEFDSSYEVKPRKRVDSGESSVEYENDFVYPLKADTSKEESNPSNSMRDNQRFDQSDEKPITMSKSESNVSRGKDIEVRSKPYSDQDVPSEARSKPKMKTRKQTNWWIAEDLTNNLGVRFGVKNNGEERQSKKSTKNEGNKSVKV